MVRRITSPKTAFAHARQLIGRSHAEFATDFDVSKVTAISWDKGSRAVPREVARQLAVKYGFKADSLTEKKSPPALMFDGEPASKQAIAAWRAFKPSKEELQAMSSRAGRLVEHLVANSTAGTNRYQQTLVALNEFLEEHTKAPLLDTVGPMVFDGTWGSLKENPPDKLLLEVIKLEANDFFTQFPPTSSVRITWKRQEVVSPLLWRSLGGPDQPDQIDSLPEDFVHEVTIEARTGMIAKFKSRHRRMFQGSPGIMRSKQTQTLHQFEKQPPAK